MDEVFKVKKTISYDLRMCNELYARNPKTVRYSIETISFLSPKNWAFIPKKKQQENAMRCNNRDDLLQLSFTLKISIFSEALLGL